MLAPESSAPSRTATFLEHLRVPLYRDGYALVLNSGLTALLGVAYWILAARNYSAHVVGVNTAAISAMMFLAGMAQLNLMSALVRFVPVLGGARGRFIAACYLVAATAALICAAVFLTGLHDWAPGLEALRSSGGMVIWFVGASVAWCVFNLQDSALTGLGAAVLVPVENFVYGVAKIVLLLAFVSVSPRYGIFGSWTAGLVVSLVPVNMVIMGLVRRRRAAGPNSDAAPPTRRDIVRFVAPDYLGALLWLAATTLMPVIVVAAVGATQNAYFSLAWMITVPLLAISSGTGTALVATAASDPHRLPEYARRVLWQTARLAIPAAVTIGIASPYVLRVFGHQYATHAATTLTLLSLSAIPYMINALYVAIYRVQRRMRAVVRLLGSLSVAVLVLGPLLLELMGIAGVGLAWLVCQCVVAAAVLSTDHASLRSGGAGALDLVADVGAVAVLRSLRARRATQGSAAELARCIPPGMVLRGIEPMVNDVVVGRATGPGERQGVIVKLARSPRGARSLHRAADGIAALRAEPRLSGWEVPSPEILDAGELDGWPYIVESELPGVTIARALSRGAPWEPLARLATGAIDGLHRRTAESVTVDQELLERWIGEPARAVEAVVGDSRRRTATLRELAEGLSGRLEGRSVTATWIHGDFVPANVLVAPDLGAITGIVDWEETAPATNLPEVDRAMFLLATHSQLARRELGQLIGGLAKGDASGVLGEALAAAADPRPERPLDPLSLALLTWMRHVAALMTKSERYRRHPLWKRYNVSLVLDALAERRPGRKYHRADVSPTASRG